jgi:hypothetical protein
MANGPGIVTDYFNPEILTDAVQGVFGQKTAFMGSRLSALGIVLVNSSMPEGGHDAIGSTVTVPYFGTIGEFTDNPDGDSLTPKKVQQITEQATISRDSLGFSVSRWAQGNAAVNPNVGDPYDESARQIMVAAERAMDKRCVTAAAATGVYLKDVYSASSPGFLDWDLCVDAKFDGWGDEQDDIAALLVHSQTHKDLMKLKDTTGRPLLLSSQGEGGPLDRFCGVPVVVSDRSPIAGSVMGAVTSSGTSPPVVTLTQTPLGAFRLVIDLVSGTAHEAATYRFSTDGGNIWSANITTPAAATAVDLVDTAVDSRVGVNGATGLQIAFAAGTFNADNLWTASTSLKARSMLLKRGALTFWYSSKHLAMETDKDIRNHTDEAAMHLYAAAHRYRRLGAGSTKPGVIHIDHNVTGF